MSRGRYAPSPTGPLHLGNARTALLAWWQARSVGGEFVLRVEDLDRARSHDAFVKANLEELRWLGLEWDEGPDVGGPHAPYVQSERFDLYKGALERLKESSHVFACYLSRQDVRDIASAPHGAAAPYGPAERALNDRVQDEKRAAGKTPSLRYRVDGEAVSFCDALQGEQTFAVGDFILKRADGEWAYQLAVVVDDIAMGIEAVMRGADLLESTAAQLIIYDALGATPPSFFHVPLLLNSEGERMAKRKGSLTLSTLKESGVPPERVIGLLAHTLGLTPEPAELTLYEGLELYSPTILSPKPFTLNRALLDWLAP